MQNEHKRIAQMTSYSILPCTQNWWFSSKTILLLDNEQNSSDMICVTFRILDILMMYLLFRHYSFHDFHSPPLDDTDFDSLPLVLVIGVHYHNSLMIFLLVLVLGVFLLCLHIISSSLSLLQGSTAQGNPPWFAISSARSTFCRTGTCTATWKHQIIFQDFPDMRVGPEPTTDKYYCCTFKPFLLAVTRLL